MVISLDDLTELARKRVREALSAYPAMPDSLQAKLTLGVQFDDRRRIFELYITGERPQDAIVVAKAVLDIDTGEGEVECFPEVWVSELPKNVGPMTVIGLIRELEPTAQVSLPSLTELKGELPAELASTISEYLERGCPVLDVMEGSRDPLNPNHYISGGPSLVSDGKWVWRLDLAYFVKQYRIRLNPEFLDYVSSGQGRFLSDSEILARSDEVQTAYRAALGLRLADDELDMKSELTSHRIVNAFAFENERLLVSIESNHDHLIRPMDALLVLGGVTFSVRVESSRMPGPATLGREIGLVLVDVPESVRAALVGGAEASLLLGALD